MKIVSDLDRIICTIKEENQSHTEAKLFLRTIKKIQKLYSKVV